MSWKPIVKRRPFDAPPPNLADWQAARGSFSWDRAQADLAGLPDGGLNIAFEAVDRHLGTEAAGRVALRWLAADGRRLDLTYAELAADVARFANVLKGLGVGRGDRVFTLLGRMPALFAAALGTLKQGGVYCPLFAAFGPEPIHTRLQTGEARVLVTTPALYRRKVAPIRDRLPMLEHVLLIGEEAEGEDTRALAPLMDAAEATCPTATTGPEDMALLHFTSGTTGRPKAAVHVHAAAAAHRITGQWALDLRPGDIYWCTADPGWVTGISYGMLAPLMNGCTVILDEAEFDPYRWLRILAEERVQVWYTAPTAIRMLMRLPDGAFADYDISALRHLASVGEPLNPEAVVWGQRIFGRPFHDTWWQTETGAIMIANLPCLDVKPGAMGRPLPGIEAAVVRPAGAGSVVPITEPDSEGELALRVGWPSMFRAYLGEPERYARRFAGDWYLTGDLAQVDADGDFWFIGRADDVIKSAGHLISPFEVESALMEHPAVAEAGVIGKPDPTVGETVKAFVTLKDGFTAGRELERDLIALARKRLGAALAPRAVEFTGDLPKTRSGKIMRRLLKAREAGESEGASE